MMLMLLLLIMRMCMRSSDGSWCSNYMITNSMRRFWWFKSFCRSCCWGGQCQWSCLLCSCCRCCWCWCLTFCCYTVMIQRLCFDRKVKLLIKWKHLLRLSFFLYFSFLFFYISTSFYFVSNIVNVKRTRVCSYSSTHLSFIHTFVIRLQKHRFMFYLWVCKTTTTTIYANTCRQTYK